MDPLDDRYKKHFCYTSTDGMMVEAPDIRPVEGLAPWVDVIALDDRRDWRCSYCQQVNEYEDKNCPHCGAPGILRGRK